MPILSDIRNLWKNAFRTYDQDRPSQGYSVGPSTSVRPHTPRYRYTNERTIVSSIYTRIAIDFAGVDIRHVKLDELGRYKQEVDSSLSKCLTYESNLDQGPRAFRQNIASTLFAAGVAAVVPVNVLIDEDTGEVAEIIDFRVGEITEWYPKHVRVSLYNENKALVEEIVIEKRKVAIIENPLYAVMNEPNSTLQRLIRKLNLLDVVDEQSSSGKLDLIIQLPYVIKSESRRQQAESRRQDIEFQLKGSQYGVAYTDGSEKITQLNRPAENNLLKQVEYLTGMLYSQLGITDAVMDGTADEKTMINYHNRTIKPLLDATIEAMQRAFLGVQGTDRKERIRYYTNPFAYIPLVELAKVVDVFSRNEIFSPNEIRGYMGVPPSDNPKADMLQNSNMPQPEPTDGQNLDL